LLLAIRLSQRSVVTGGTLTVGIRTAAQARNTVMSGAMHRRGNAADVSTRNGSRGRGERCQV
jgi:hypothetical protein